MPFYEYYCSACQQQEEKAFPISSHPKKVKCSNCGGWAVKVFRPAPILFKGSGFYTTDSRAKPQKEVQPKEEKPSTSSKKEEPKKSESAGKKAS